MTILARRFTYICLFMALFAAGLAAVVQHGARADRMGMTGLGAPCPQPAGILCRTVR